MLSKKSSNMICCLLSAALIIPNLTAAPILAEEIEVELSDSSDAVNENSVNSTETESNDFSDRDSIDLEIGFSKTTENEAVSSEEEIELDSNKQGSEKEDSVANEGMENFTIIPDLITNESSVIEAEKETKTEENSIFFEDCPETSPVNEQRSDLVAEEKENIIQDSNSDQSNEENSTLEENPNVEKQELSSFYSSGFVINNGVLESYNGTAATVRIPSNVKTIGRRAFAGNTSIQSVIISSSVIDINYDAFRGCTGIRSVSFGSHVQNIGDSAFNGCIGLRSISLPSSVRTIGNSTFANCSALQSISLNNGLTSIGEEAFVGTKLIQISVPNSVKSIGYKAFADLSTLTSLTVGNSVTEIPCYMASGCSNLKTVKLGSGIKYIQGSAFKDDSSLNSINFPAGLVEITSHWRGGAFENCINLKQINLPANLKYIGNYSFKNTGLTGLTVPANVTEIANEAFRDCLGLKSVSFNNKIEKLGECCFQNTGVKSITIPNSVTSIGYASFADNSYMTSITVGNKASEIPVSFCAGNVNLKNVKIGNAVTVIRGNAFRKCTSLSSINIPSSVTLIEHHWRGGAFEDCPSLTSITLPNSLTEIGPYSFQKSGLKGIIIPDSVTVIGEGAFAYCLDLVRVDMSNSISSMGVSWNNISLPFRGSSNMVMYIYSGCNYAVDHCNQTGITYRSRGIFKPAKVTNLKAVHAGKKKVKISWDHVSGAEYYVIMGSKNGKYQRIGATTNNYFTDTKALDTQYNFYWVFPGYKNYTTGQGITGPCPKYVYAKGTIPAVKNLKGGNSTRGAYLTWNKAAGADGYLIYGYRNGSNNYSYIGHTTKNQFYDTKASKTKYSFYWVFPYHWSNGKRVIGGKPNYVYAKTKS